MQVRVRFGVGVLEVILVPPRAAVLGSSRSAAGFASIIKSVHDFFYITQRLEKAPVASLGS